MVGYAGGVNALHPTIPSRPITIRCERLATFSEVRGTSPTLVKIDVEGHEPEVIEGLGSFLDQRPTLLFEVWNEELGSRNTAPLIESLLANRGYIYFATDEKTPFHSVTSLESRDQLKLYTNFIACREQVAASCGLL